ncbi:hypothetical protein ACT3SZ_15365 [Corynebacterium sp. AOP40-9SA-29]|uniref:hypothetical protein n=1 Tax=Corynebacterium sp. AOP40-9SA-29 TaxID=3457677 RepID=UPI004034085C
MKNARTNSFSRTTQRNTAKEEAAPTVETLLPKAKDDRKLLAFRIEEEKRKALKAKAAQEGTTVQEVLYAAVDRFLST